MSRTPSNMVELGTKASYFALPNVINNKMVQFNEHTQHKAIVICFICNHCPYVKHINKELVHLANEYSDKDVLFLAISSNDVVNYPDDSPEHMKLVAQQEQYPFPYLYDETQEVAKAYQAACTPDFYLFDQEHYLVYRGQLDDSRPGNDQPVTGESLRNALECTLNNRLIELQQKPSLGCNIKWKS